MFDDFILAQVFLHLLLLAKTPISVASRTESYMIKEKQYSHQLGGYTVLMQYIYFSKCK